MSYTFHRALIAALAVTPRPTRSSIAASSISPGNVTADGKHHDTFAITFSDIQAAWSKDGHTDALPATVKLVAWGSDGMPDNANMTKVNWSVGDNRRCEVCEAGYECACSVG